MKTFEERLNELWEEAQISIIEKIRKIGVESDHHNFPVIKLKDELCFNTEGGRYLTEIGQTNCYDNLGHHYSYGSLYFDQLTEIADWVQTLK